MNRNALTLKEVEALVASMFTASTLSSRDPQLIQNETAKVLNKIGLMITIRGRYVDKLEDLDGPELPLGKTIEEYFMELPKVLEEDRDGSEDGKPADPSFLPAYYSYSLPKKRIKITRRWDEYEAACQTEEQFLAFIAVIEAAIEESTIVYKYALKRELIGRGIKLIESIIDATASGTALDGATITTSNGDLPAGLKPGDYIVVTEAVDYKGPYVITETGFENDQPTDELVAAGFVTKLDLAQDVAKPTNTAEGEAFIKAVLDDVEKASENSEGHSLNGATIGATEDLRLFTLQGVKSVLAVDVKAGAFHKDEVELGARLTSIKDFGNYNGRTWAVLCDVRTFVLFLGYINVRVRENADGDFINYVRHLRYTPFMSRSTFIKLYREPAGE